MVFPSVPVYLDPPNWNQLQQSFPFPTAGGGGGGGGGGGSGGGEVPPLIPGLVAVTRPPEAAGMAAGPDSASRTVSMSERARLAKIPQPEQPLKCPRCDSSNTKFCYYNNYSLSQPRHFCKACRRYWTRGGALRNVPVGGGCRRNKRSSKSSGGSSSKSTADRQAGGGTSSSSSTATGGGGGSGISPVIPQHGQFPFVVSMPTTLGHYGAANNLGLNFGIPTMDAVTAEYQVGGNSSNIGLEQWRLPQIQQFPFLGGGLEPPVPAVQPSMSGLYHFTGEARQVDGAKAVSGSSLITQLASVKMEDHNDQLRLNFPRQYLGLSGNDQYNWSGTGGATGEGGSATSGSSWAMTDLSVFNSSSSGNNIL